MALTPETVGRENEAAGQAFAVLNDGSARHQSVVLADADGNPVAYGTNYSSSAAEDSEVIQSGSGVVGEVHGYLDGLSGLGVCIMLFDASSLPVNGTAPAWRIPLLGGVGTYFWPTGFQYSTGLVVAFSSTHATLTVTTTSEGFFHTRRI